MEKNIRDRDDENGQEIEEAAKNNRRAGVRWLKEKNRNEDGQESEEAAKNNKVCKMIEGLCSIGRLKTEEK